MFWEKIDVISEILRFFVKTLFSSNQEIISNFLAKSAKSQVNYPNLIDCVRDLQTSKRFSNICY